MMHISEGNGAKRPVLVRITALLLAVLCIALYIPGTSFAGKEGVFINNSVYFTLEQVSISKAADSQMMRFNVTLNNNGESYIDFNRYGVKVTTEAGAAYSAQLSEKADALSAPNSAVPYYFVAKIPGNLTAEQLKVTIFERNGDSTRDIGSLSVASAQAFTENAHQLLVNLSDVDSTLKGNTFIAFQAMRAFAFPQDGKWTVTLDLTASPSGTDSVTLPTALKYSLLDGQGQAVDMTANAVEGNTIGSGQTKHIVLSATMKSLPGTDKLQLEFKPDGSTTSLGKLALGSVFQNAKAGDRVSYLLQGQDGITVEVQKAEIQQQNGKNQTIATAVLHNDSKRTVQSPDLLGAFVSANDVLTINASTVGTPKTYIAAGDTGVYRFAAELPDGVNKDNLQLFVAEKPASTTGNNTSQTSSNSGSSTQQTGTSAAATQTGSTTSSSQSNSQTSGVSSGNTIPVLAAALQDAFTAAGNYVYVPQYKIGEPFVFDNASRLIDSNLEVSVVELSSHTDSENGFQTAVAKFKLLNKSSETLTIPAFDTQLTDASGTSYPGTRQTTTLQQLIPNTAYVFSYTYMLPPSVKGDFKLSILDNSSSAGVKVPISENLVTVAESGSEDPTALQKVMSFYPFNVTVQDWTISATYSGSAYNYKLKLGLDIKKVEQVIVDDSFSKLEFEVVDATNRVLGSTTQVLQGANKLINGTQTITFDSIKSEQLEYPVTIKVYEDITTSTGTARRLVATFSQ
ncbi:hypothetical protein [Paenibacillus thalictri]|uniref:Uncharacterized protein n=1 Tax=Paenibacillus thalictri TaxID=2527873 RepID=A0A4V6MSJ4_9BACL|nr:hypothetical protein [Paenibacillus thalictri]TBL81372.1 hypothetical protein EYB31_04650 [Paenibacillus thalictri]